MWILVEKLGARLSPGLLQGLALSMRPGRLQARRLGTVGVVRSWKCGKVQSCPDEDKVSCRIWRQHGCRWLGLLCYEHQTFLPSSTLRIRELLMFTVCILNRRCFVFSSVKLVPSSAFWFFPLFFKIYLLLLRKEEKKKAIKATFYI